VTRTIDLNCDLGESPDRLRDGTDLALLDVVSSANVACGGHAGDEDTMAAVAHAAIERRVAIGAHPGYPDPANFGRVSIPMPPQRIESCVLEQTQTLQRIARAAGGRVTHLKPHGALYHDAMHNPEIARAIGDAARRADPALVLVAMAGSSALELWRSQGIRVAGEAFADRTYEPDGTLRARSRDGALITDPDLAAAQALRLVQHGTAQTLCVHSDTPSALAIAREVRAHLEHAGVRIAAL
jgi:UPF0271 protein